MNQRQMPLQHLEFCHCALQGGRFEQIVFKGLWRIMVLCFKNGTYVYNIKLPSEVRARILGCQAQMTRFDYFFGLHLSHRLLSHTDNLSKTLKQKKLSAASGHYIASLSKTAVQSIRNDESFNAFYDTVLLKKEIHPTIGHPSLPRKKRTPARYEIGSGKPSFSATAKEEYRKNYFEAIDLLVSALDHRFGTQSFSSYIQLESFLLNVLDSKDYDKELAYISETYEDDIDIAQLQAQLPVFKLIMKSSTDVVCFHDILQCVQTLPEGERTLISEVVMICKLLNLNPATSSTAERSFSAARQLKSWSRATMGQQRFNSLAILNIHKVRTDNLWLHSVANEFINNNKARQTQFGVLGEGHFDRKNCYTLLSY